MGEILKVKILGTGSIYSRSNCTGLVIDEQILVDIGPGTVKQLIKENISLTNINTILLTHLHSDHILDFPLFVVNLKVIGINHKINIYSPKGTKEKLNKLLISMYEDHLDMFINTYFNFIDIKDNDIIEIDNKKVEVKRVVHEGINEAYGYIIDSKIGITGDSSYCDNVVYIFNNSEVFICDLSCIKGDIYHMGIDDIQKIRKMDKSKTIIPIHYRDKTREKLKNINIENLLVVEDGYEFNI